MIPPLRACQIKALEIAGELPRFGFYFDTGTGKTRTACAIIAHDLWAGGGNWLVVTPRSVIPGWLEECRRWVIPGWSPTPTLLTKRGLVCQGWGGKKEGLIKEMNAAEGTVTICNPESLKRLGNRKYHGLIVDESAIMQNEKALITRSLVKLSLWADRVYLLSGNPSPNGPLYLWSQAHVLGAFHGKWWAWANIWGYQDKFRKWTLRKGNDEKILEMMRPSCWYLDKKDVLDLPPVSVIKREFVPSSGGDTWQALVEAVRTDGLGCVMRWRTEASGFFYLSEKDADGKKRRIGTHVGHTDRLDALRQLLTELAGRKVVIWFQFSESERQILELLAELGLATTDDPERFREGDKAVLLAHPRSIGKGTDGLQHLAQDMIFFEISYSYDEYYQCLSRLHRSGQERPVAVYLLIASGSVDEEALKAIENKEDLADRLRRALGRTE